MGGTAMLGTLSMNWLIFITLLTVKADDCSKGFYGPGCWRRCKEQSHCLNDDCVLLPSGRALNCSQGCKSGWRGLSCNTNCKHPCIQCDRNTGECVGACRDGYYGDRCYKYCPQHCVNCEKVSGSCSNCAPGFYGEDCSLNCSKECEECDVKSGECLNRTNDDESATKASAYNRVVKPGRLGDGVDDASNTKEAASNRVVEPGKLSDGLDIIKLGFHTENSCAIITCVSIVLVIILLSLFFARQGRNSGQKEPDSKIRSTQEYEYQDKKYMKLEQECVSPSTYYVFPHTASSLEHLNPDLGTPKGMVNTLPYIAPCPPYPGNSKLLIEIG